MCLCLFVERAGDTGGGGGGSTGPATADLVSDDDYGQSTDTELLFRCRICWKGFKHPMSLTLHKDLHTGQTRCPICQRIFSRSYDMKAHLLRIHKCTFSVDAKLNFRKWSLHEHIDTYCRDILSINLSAIKRRRTTFSFFLFALIFFYCYYYMLHVHIISLFFSSLKRYPIQSILNCSPEFLFRTFFSFFFFLICTISTHIYRLYFIFFFFFIYIYTYVVKPVNRHDFSQKSIGLAWFLYALNRLIL